ncbi:MAG: DNRLRE domain-containing protein [Ardenticatenales bacterium]|nr:DNRLRE domain-containing protein [Ardenticatenales bacterium]
MRKLFATIRRGWWPILLIGILVLAWQSGNRPVRATGAAEFTPTADAHVTLGAPNQNYGTGPTLHTRNLGSALSFLQFTVTDLAEAPTQVILGVYVEATTTTEFDLYAVADNSWTESGLTYNNQPALGQLLDSVTAVTGPSWVFIDVSAYVTGNGVYSFALADPDNTQQTVFSSREGSNAPTLTIDGTPPLQDRCDSGISCIWSNLTTP